MRRVAAGRPFSGRLIFRPNENSLGGEMKAICLIAGAALFGVSTSAWAADTITLKFWDNQQTESGLSEHQKDAVSRFEAENPNIKVEVSTIPYREYQQRLLTAVEAGNAPDVSTIDQIWVAAFAKADAVEPLDKLAADAGIKPETFFPGAWSSAVYDGKLWGIPFNVDSWFFTYYNASLFKAAGVDPESTKTWAGLKAAAEKLTGDGKYGIGLFGHKGEDTVLIIDTFISSNGGHVLDSNGKCALTSPEAVEALNFVASMVPYAPKGIANASSEDMRELFLNGSLAMEFWPELEQPTLQKSKLDWGFVAGTAPDGKKAIGTYGGWNLVVYKQSKYKEAAWKFIQFLIRDDVNGEVVDLPPANIKGATAFLAKNRQGPDRIIEYLNNAAPRPLSAHYLEVSDIEVTLAQDIYAGVPAKDAAAKACKAIDALE
jgi:ABC-type glycerol-3-phosphate transport system substrate-binding protein